MAPPTSRAIKASPFLANALSCWSLRPVPRAPLVPVVNTTMDDLLLRRPEGHFVRDQAAPHSDPDACGEDDPRTAREWLVTNGLGGYAAGTVSGFITRRFHGLLIAALPGAAGAHDDAQYLSERVRMPDRSVATLNGREKEEGVWSPESRRILSTFVCKRVCQLDLPRWRDDHREAPHPLTRTKHHALVV